MCPLIFVCAFFPGLSTSHQPRSVRVLLQAFVGLCKQFPAQIVALAAQVSWSGSVLNALKDAQLGSAGGLKACLEGLSWRLLAMSESVLGKSPPALRRKYEQLITELVRQRDATRRLQVTKGGRMGCSGVEWRGKGNRFHGDMLSSSDLGVGYADAYCWLFFVFMR